MLGDRLLMVVEEMPNRASPPISMNRFAVVL
jgi:hypothetical protein